MHYIAARISSDCILTQHVAARVTTTAHLRSLSAESIAEWNSSGSREQTMDVAWWHRPALPPEKNVRLRFSGGQLADHSRVPTAEEGRVLPVAVVPPLVNAHTHLEFSSLSEPIGPSSPFPDWIRSVIRWRIGQADSAVPGLEQGLAESRANSVSVIGEITTSDGALATLQDSQQNIVSFRELIGFLPDRIFDQISVMTHHLDAIPETGRVQAGISPHAPYSVHPDLFLSAVETCAQRAIPLAMHLGETTDELELLAHGTGHFVDFLQEMNLWDATVLPKGSRILDYLHQLARLPHSLAIHCNYIDDEEIRFLGQNPQIAVVYCPRTHHYFGHESHPWQKITAAGGTVVLGTDGRSSNPDLSIWKELQFLAAQSLTATLEDLLPMVTSRAASALGLHEDDPAIGNSVTLIGLPEVAHTADCLLSGDSEPLGVLQYGQEAARICSGQQQG